MTLSSVPAVSIMSSTTNAVAAFDLADDLHDFCDIAAGRRLSMIAKLALIAGQTRAPSSQRRRPARPRPGPSAPARGNSS